MAEYIERDALLRDIEESVVFSGRTGVETAEMRGADKIIQRIKAAPAADVRPVVRGRWLKKSESLLDGGFSCSHCRDDIDIGDGEETPLDRGFLFCPNCGSDMRKGCDT